MGGFITSLPDEFSASFRDVAVCPVHGWMVAATVAHCWHAVFSPGINIQWYYMM